MVKYLSHETNYKTQELIIKLEQLANDHNLRFDYFTYSFQMQFQFNNARFKVLYKHIRDKSVEEIYNSIYYSLHHNYRLIKS